DLDATSMMSPYLRYGEVSPRQIWHRVLTARANDRGSWSYLREVGWREFSYHLLYHFPHTTTKPLNERFRQFPWADDDDNLVRWQRGQTGYPIVDAGMRQLWHIGWMHNRVRMIVASFLTKDLLIPWQEGARWFWDTLVDGDLANNTQGWQWTAGSGADAQPFFRIFNPVSQGQRFDPEGDYVRKWVPEIRNLPNEYVHRPWEAPADVLDQAGLELGSDYPLPIVDHSDARKSAMSAYESLPK
ncbi:MAG: FAD-binding domain-containing protein, partial [Rhodothermales bacterium]|nr:FAD-binding domain-containing protein [Rhodothermales bacterium]